DIDRHEAKHGFRVRGRRQSSLLQGQQPDALWRRQEDARRSADRVEGVGRRGRDPRSRPMPVTRRLVAVVVADVVGYSRLMERDEAGTHARMRELRERLLDPKIAEHGGRTVKTTGDGMLLEFPSATSALRCAVEVQREMGARNLYVAPDARIEF